jgi:5'(3')-deoxyribonucleotidase
MSRLALDLDEVLVPLLRPMAKWYGVDTPRVKHKYLFREVFECSEEQSKRILHEFYESKDFLYLKPLPGAQRAMRAIKDMGWYDKMYIITGRQDVVRDVTQMWVNAHFPGIFDDVLLTNSFTEYEVKKSDLCKSLGVSLIIDDSFENCKQCVDVGVDAIHFIGYDDRVYPWCKEQMSDDVKCFQDWTTIQEA